MAESSPLSNPNPVVVHQRAASIRAAGEAEDALVSEVFGELEVGQMGGSGPQTLLPGSEVQITIHICSCYMILLPMSPHIVAQYSFHGPV